MNNRRYNVSDVPIVLNIIIYGLLTVAVVVLQTTLMPRLRVFGVCPDLAIAAVCCVGIYSGEKVAAVFGLVIGLCMTSLGTVGVSLVPLLYVFVGYFCGRVGLNSRNNTRFFAYLISIPAVCLSRTFISFIDFHIQYWGSIEYGRLILNILLPEFLYTLVMALPVFVIVKLFELPLPKDRNGGDVY